MGVSKASGLDAGFLVGVVGGMGEMLERRPPQPPDLTNYFTWISVGQWELVWPGLVARAEGV